MSRFPFRIKSFTTFLFKRKRPFKLTRGGLIFILYTIGIGAGAINTGNNLLYLIFGLFLGVILASGVLSDFTLWGIEAEFEPPYSVEEGEVCSIPLVINNRKKKMPSLSVRVQAMVQLGKESFTLDVYTPFLSVGGKSNGQFLFRPPRRGWLYVTKIKYSTRFPFGLLEKWWTEEPNAIKKGTFVFPKKSEEETSLMMSGSEGSDESIERPNHGEGIFFSGVRDYLPSDNPRRIHWKSTARRHSLVADATPAWLVKDLEREETPRLHLSWGDWKSLGRLSSDQLESLIQRTAACAADLAQKNWLCDLLIQLPEGWVRVNAETASHHQPLMEFLTLFEWTETPAPQAIPYFEKEGESFFLAPSDRVVNLRAS